MGFVHRLLVTFSAVLLVLVAFILAPTTPTSLAAPPAQSATSTFSGSGLEGEAVYAEPLGGTFLTQNTSQSVVAGSIACNTAGLHADNSYYRVFNLAALGITSSFSIDEVSFGIEEANASGTGTTQPVVVNLYTLSGPFMVANLTLIGSESLSISDQSFSIFSAAMSPEVVAPGSSMLVVEVFTPNGQTAGHSFFMGSNAAGQSAPSYIRAPACGAAQPTNLSTIGFPNMHIVLNVSGEILGGATPTPTATATATSTTVPPTNTPTPTNTTVPPTNTPTRTNTPVPPTNTPTVTVTPTGSMPPATNTPTVTATPGGGGNRFCSSTPITIPDANPTGATGTITVGSAGTISDLNVIITGTHSWVGDIRLNLSNGTTNVTFYDQPGVPASTFGCSGDNLPGVVGDDEGVNGSFENSCQNATPAYTPGGSYTNNNALSAFDGSATNATWTLTASDLAAGDTGTIDSWCVEFSTGAGPTPTVTPSPTVPGQVPDINLNPSSFNETHSSPPQTTTDTLNVQNVGTGTLTWTIAEDDTRPFANPNAAQPRDPNAPTQRLGGAGGATTSKLELGLIVGDGSFETGTPNASWEEFSSNFGTPLCDAVCGTGGGTGPRTGAWWAWFGGTTAAETGIITQTVTIPSGSAELSFWLEIPATATGTNGFLSVRMDGTEVFRAEETTTGYATYAEVTVDVSAYADGGAHELVFFSVTDAGAAVTNFFVDDVAITAQAGGQCTAPTDIPWLTVSPLNGSTAGGGSTPVTLTYNSTSLAQGVYTGTLCVASNDPDEALVTVPITLNVGPPTAIDLASFTSPVNGVNLADLAAAGLLLLAGAVLVLRRK